MRVFTKTIIEPEYLLSKAGWIFIVGLNYEGVPVVSSRTIGDVFVKEHYHVLRNIDNLIEDSECLDHPNFRESYFIKSTYRDSRNREYNEYLLTKDGFTLLVKAYSRTVGDVFNKRA